MWIIHGNWLVLWPGEETKHDMTCCCNEDGKEVKYGELFVDACNTCFCGGGCTEAACVSDDDMDMASLFSWLWLKYKITMKEV